MLTIKEEKIGHEEGLRNWFKGPDSAGGVSVSLTFRNDFNKTIKYIYFVVVPYNAVGDIVKCDISGQEFKELNYTGPLASGQTAWDRRWDNCFYNFSIIGIKVVAAVVEFTDGTKQTIKSFNRGGSRPISKSTGNENKSIFGQTIEKKRLILACIVLGAVIFTLISLKFVVMANRYWLFVFMRVWYYLQLIVPLGFIIIEIIGILQFNENIQKKLELAIIFTCLSFNVLHTILGVVAVCLSGYMNYAFISIILNLPFTIAYFVCNKKLK